MTRERLYAIAWKTTDDDSPEDALDPRDAETSEPEGWPEYCQERWGEYRPFFWPSTRRIYRSKSAAVERAALINRWGGDVVVLEGSPAWQTVESAARDRAIEKQHKRVVAQRLELSRAQHKLDALVEGADL